MGVGLAVGEDVGVGVHVSASACTCVWVCVSWEEGVVSEDTYLHRLHWIAC